MSNCIKVSIRNIWAMHMINISMRFFRCRWQFISWQCTLSSLVWRSLLGEQNYCLRVSHMFSESWVAPCLVCLVWHMELCNLFKWKNNWYRIITLPCTISVTLLSCVSFPDGSDGKESAYNTGELGSIPE